MTRLYKDGIGAAYRIAKAAASAAVIQGISKDAFEEFFLPACKNIESDNAIGKFVFNITRLIQKYSFARRAVIKMVAREQTKPSEKRYMSTILWDMFTGSASYREILMRAFHPGFWSRFIIDLITSLVSRPRTQNI